MDDSPELLLKKLCCTCLSQDRKLKKLCRLTEGINNLYLLLSYDSEAYKEGFYKDTAHWFICWECWAVMTKISRFRSQACLAQRHLSEIVDGRTDLKLFSMCLSGLTRTHKETFDQSISLVEDAPDNFIDCGPDIKSGSDEDVPLSELHNNYLADDRQYSDDDTMTQEVEDKKTLQIQPVYKKRKKNNNPKKKKNDLLVKKKHPKDEENKTYFTTTQMTEEEMLEYRQKSKMAATYADAKFKCESCIVGFKNQIDLVEHVSKFHTEKKDHTKCDICLAYTHTPLQDVSDHRSTHYTKYQCVMCNAESYSTKDIQSHISMHQSVEMVGKKGSRKMEVRNPGSKSRRSRVATDERTPFGYKCAECDKYFENKNVRWKHVQRHHREGYKCSTCDKRFAFKNNLARHEMQHLGPPPRVECPQCNKQVRVDLLKIHSRIHTTRARYACAECDKRFISRASYEHHLKYTAKHAVQPLNKYKCSMCDKGYRSRGELRDHVNYQHMGKTQHKCPICEKALATPRCITRHVRRAHHGVKEQPRDKICQQCGKAFRDKKTLREHEFIHTGERPLSCEICGCTFRQSASLYTHRKRVHKIYPVQKRVELMQTSLKESTVEGLAK